jgi:hypothetical protein
LETKVILIFVLIVASLLKVDLASPYLFRSGYFFAAASNNTHCTRMSKNIQFTRKSKMSISAYSIKCFDEVKKNPQFRNKWITDVAWVEIIKEQCSNIPKDISIKKGSLNNGFKNGWTEFGIIHHHFRCVEIEVENCKRVLEQHEFISPSDTDTEAKAKLVEMLGCPADDICNCDMKNVNSFASVHKAFYYARWLDCPDLTLTCTSGSCRGYTVRAANANETVRSIDAHHRSSFSFFLAFLNRQIITCGQFLSEHPINFLDEL